MWTRFKHDRRGIAAVEFSLLAPVFLMLLLGAVETGRLMWTRSVLQFAAEEAARYALVRGDATIDQIKAAARNRLIGIGTSPVTIVVTSNGNEIEVEASQDFAFLAKGLLPFGAVHLTGASRMPRK